MTFTKKNCFSLLIMLFAVLIFSSCKKEDDPNKQLATDIELIKKHLEQNGIEAVEHESGLFYTIVKAGEAQKPTAYSIVTVNYSGSFLNGTEFDSGEFFTNRLSSLIKGWQIGIPLIGSGGRIQLYIPSDLAYGNRQTGSIPPNTVLFFDVTLHYFSN